MNLRHIVRHILPFYHLDIEQIERASGVKARSPFLIAKIYASIMTSILSGQSGVCNSQVKTHLAQS
jgi:hypothetical protein